MEITERAKKLVASSLGGLGVLGSLVGFGLKGDGNQANSTEVKNISAELQQNSQDILALAKDLGGDEQAQALDIGKYLGQVATDVAEGKLPNQKEIQQAQNKLNDLGNKQSATGDKTSQTDSNDNNRTKADRDSNNKSSSDKNSAGNNKDDNSVSGRSDRQTADKKSNDSPENKSADGGKNSGETGTSSQNGGVSTSDSGKPSVKSDASETGGGSGSGGGLGGGSGGGSGSSGGAEETSEQVDDIESQLGGLETGLEEMNGLFDDTNEQAEEEITEVEQSNQQLNDFLETLEAELAENEEQLDSSQNQNTEEFDNFGEFLASLMTDLDTVNQESLDTQNNTSEQLASDKQNLTDRLAKVENLITSILEGRVLSDNSSNDDSDVSVPQDLATVAENMEDSFTPFRQSLVAMNEQLESSILTNENNVTSLIKSLDDGDNQLGQFLDKWQTDITQKQEVKASENLKRVRDNLTDALQNLQENSLETVENFVNEIHTSGLENIETVLAKMLDNLDEFEPINDNLTALIQSINNYSKSTEDSSEHTDEQLQLTKKALNYTNEALEKSALTLQSFDAI